MKLKFPDMDLSLHMEGGYCVYSQGNGEKRVCRLLEVRDDRRGVLRDVVAGNNIPVDDVFSSAIDWSWPELGLIGMPAQAVHVARMPVSQYRRTLRLNSLSFFCIGAHGVYESRTLGDDFLLELFNPTYPKDIGILRWRLLSGRSESVALSHKLALCARDDDNCADLDLFYGTVRVGVVDSSTMDISGWVTEHAALIRAADKHYNEWRYQDDAEVARVH